MELDILFVGSCCTDFISYVPHFPKLGETIHGHRFMTAFGGKAANQTVMAARLGANVSLVAKVGDDHFGKDTIHNFRRNGVNTEFIQQANGMSTGVVLVTVDGEGQNSFISVKGSNDQLTPLDVDEVFKGVKSAKLVVSEMEIKRETTLRALQRARTAGSLTLLNPSPAVSNLDSEFYKLSDIICINQKEAELLTGLPVTNIEETKKAALILLERGCQKVIITLGKDGAVLVTAETKTPEHIAVDPVTPVDTTWMRALQMLIHKQGHTPKERESKVASLFTIINHHRVATGYSHHILMGAGDCFLGALSFYLARLPHLTMSEMVKRSNQIAALSVLSPGTQLSYPWKQDLPPELFS